MNIGLAFDLQTDSQDVRQAEFDPPSTLDAIERALEAPGHTVRRLGGARDLLADRSPLAGMDMVFNVAEGEYGACREAWLPILLELWGVPYVGSDALALALGLDKVMSKRLAVASGVVTPRWVSVSSSAAPIATAALRFPCIVKPRYEGSGVGIDPQAVVRDLPALRARVQWALAQFAQPCLIEEFIPFGELTVLVLGNDPPQALPAVQRLIDAATGLSCHVARAPERSPWSSPVELTPALDQAAQRMALTMFEALGCRDMARVDLRVDEAGRLYFLEINPLPSFDPEGTVGLLAESLGISYAALIGRIVEAAAKRLSGTAVGSA